MMRRSCIGVLLVVAALVSMPTIGRAQEVPTEYQQVLTTLGTQGDVKDGVRKV
jgi:hypothetical protein